LLPKTPKPRADELLIIIQMNIVNEIQKDVETTMN